MKMLHRRFVNAIAPSAALLAFSIDAHADPSATDRARADALFEEAKSLMAQNRFLEACPKLVEARRIEPGAGGTLLALALCHEGEQKLATALSELRDAKRMAQGKNADRETLAGEHIAALETHVSKITFTHAEGYTSLTVDGVAVDLSRAFEVDGGEHVVRAESPGKRGWEARVNVATKDDSRVVDLPVAKPDVANLDARGGSSIASSTEPEAHSNPHEAHTRTIGLVVGGVGIVATLVGGYFGVRALNAQSESQGLCPSSPCTNGDGVARHTDAQHAAVGADIGIAVGVAAIATGAILVLLGNGQASTAKRTPLVSPLFTERSAGLGMSGRF